MNQGKEQNVKECNETKIENESVDNAPIIFEICKSEYENERARTNTIDSKISIITAIVTALIVAIFATIDFSALLVREINTVKDALFYGLLIFLSFGALLTTAISLFTLLVSLMTRTYLAIDPFEYLKIEFLREENNYYYIICANKYAECSKHNREVNEKRCKKYNTSIVLLFIALILFILYYIFLSLL